MPAFNCSPLLIYQPREVERRTAKERWPETDVLPLSHADHRTTRRRNVIRWNIKTAIIDTLTYCCISSIAWVLSSSTRWLDSIVTFRFLLNSSISCTTSNKMSFTLTAQCPVRIISAIRNYKKLITRWEYPNVTWQNVYNLICLLTYTYSQIEDVVKPVVDCLFAIIELYSLALIVEVI